MQRTTLPLAAACAALMAAAPLGGAHLTNPAGSTSSAAFTGDNCRWGGQQTSCGSFLNNGVSGTYIGPSGAFVYSDIPFPGDLPRISASVAECNLETLSSGEPTDPLRILDESTVDSAYGNGGAIPDGTWDDGGIGGACHSTHYADATYNTLGCGGIAHAEDAVTGSEVWTSAACDDISYFGLGTATCLSNVASAGLNDLGSCLDTVTCVINQSCGVGTLAFCGADGQADAVSYGEGGGNNGEGVPYPDSEIGCTPVALPFVYMPVAIEVNEGSDDETAGIELQPPTAGWIDWTSIPPAGGNGPGLKLALPLPLALPACLDNRDNDGDGQADYPNDPGCSSPLDNSERDSSLPCDDGVDNDSDGSTDYPNDPGCSSPTDPTETDPTLPCDDGVDNDGDGRTDYPDDPGCTSASDPSERGTTQCDDGLDNDHDRVVDYPRDPDCDSPSDNSENPPPPPPAEGCTRGC
jgi:hypothetical protein